MKKPLNWLRNLWKSNVDDQQIDVGVDRATKTAKNKTRAFTWKAVLIALAVGASALFPPVAATIGGIIGLYHGKKIYDQYSLKGGKMRKFWGTMAAVATTLVGALTAGAMGPIGLVAGGLANSWVKKGFDKLAKVPTGAKTMLGKLMNSFLSCVPIYGFKKIIEQDTSKFKNESEAKNKDLSESPSPKTKNSIGPKEAHLEQLGHEAEKASPRVQARDSHAPQGAVNPFAAEEADEIAKLGNKLSPAQSRDSRATPQARKQSKRTMGK